MTSSSASHNLPLRTLDPQGSYPQNTLQQLHSCWLFQNEANVEIKEIRRAGRGSEGNNWLDINTIENMNMRDIHKYL